MKKQKKQIKTIGLDPEVWDVWLELLALDRVVSNVPNLSWNSFMRRVAPVVKKELEKQAAAIKPEAG